MPTTLHSFAVIRPATTHPTLTDDRVELNSGAVNLDSYSADALMALWSAIRCHPVTVARALRPERTAGYVTATEELGCYACNKAVAIRCRLRGDIVAAQCYEHACDLSYERLPEWARW